MFLHTFTPQPILATIGPLTVHWYGLFLAVGALAAFFVFRWLGRRYGFKVAELETLFFLMVVAGIIGARLYHVSNEWSVYASRPKEIFSIWNGGLAIHGALLAGLIVMVLYARRKKLSFWRLADCAVPAVALGQAIGRWGNYFNQELFGRPTNLPWGIPIEPLNRPIQYIGSTFFHPTFLYESLGSLAVFALLMLMHRRALSQQPGDGPRYVGLIALLYFVLESLVRIGTEFLRVDEVPLLTGVRLPLLVSIGIALAASLLLFYRTRFSKTA